MLKTYPKIKFVYSHPYDQLLTEYENKKFSKSQERELRHYIENLQLKWRRVENLVFRELETITKNRWEEKEIKCYVVKYCKYSGISHPLTVRSENDFDYTIEALIHELCHIILSYNIRKYKKIEQQLRKQFPKEDKGTLLHIYIIFIEFKVLKKVFGHDFVDKIIEQKQKTGLWRVWRVVLKEGKNLEKFFKN